MPGVVGGFLDQVKEDPAQVDGAGQAEQDVGGWASMFTADARNCQVRGGAHDLLGPLRTLPVGGDDIAEAQRGVDFELVAALRERGLQVAAVDPAPLDVGEMVDDADDR